MAVAKRSGTTKFGWCMTSDCKNCPYDVGMDRKCGCKCHNTS